MRGGCALPGWKGGSGLGLGEGGEAFDFPARLMLTAPPAPRSAGASGAE